MFQPHNYGIALAFMLVSMLSWGSWANTMKMVPRMPFQLFYWDYVVGVILISIIWGLTLGSHGADGRAFYADLANADVSAFVYALLAGALFNVANLLLVASISVAGLAVAFPIGIGLALTIGVILNYWLAPAGNVLLLAAGVALVLGAIYVDALAFKRRASAAESTSKQGVALALASGVLMGLFYPLVVKAQVGEQGFGPYGVALVFALGVAICAIPVNTFLMRRPLTDDPPAKFSRYFAATSGEHLWGVIGGMIWGTGLIFSLVPAKTSLVGPAISYAIGQGATMVSALWGVFIWREFAQAPAASRRLIPPMFLLFIFGLALIAIAPLW